MMLLRPALQGSGLHACDLAFEAVVEDLETKQRVFAEAGRRLPADAILASNTSSLSIAALAAATSGPERVVGMHFFNPVDRMQLVEVVSAPRTCADDGNTALAFARRLGKTPILVRDAPGFLVNRLLVFYAVEALWLVHEGHAIDALDRAMADWGMPVGPLALLDELGIDLASHVMHRLSNAFSPRLPLPPWLDRLPAEGRLGVRTGNGFYRYRRGRRSGVDPQVV